MAFTRCCNWLKELFLRKVYASCPSAQPPASRRTTGSIPVPMVVTSHDKQNTVNASQLLKLGAFKLQPLVDFIEYTELIKLRLEVRGRLQGPGRFGLGLHLQPGCKPITQAWHHCLVGFCQGLKDACDSCSPNHLVRWLAGWD